MGDRVGDKTASPTTYYLDHQQYIHQRWEMGDRSRFFVEFECMSRHLPQPPEKTV